MEGVLVSYLSARSSTCRSLYTKIQKLKDKIKACGPRRWTQRVQLASEEIPSPFMNLPVELRQLIYLTSYPIPRSLTEDVSMLGSRSDTMANLVAPPCYEQTKRYIMRWSSSSIAQVIFAFGLAKITYDSQVGGSNQFQGYLSVSGSLQACLSLFE